MVDLVVTKVSEIGRCASLLAVLRRGIDTRWYASKDAGSQRRVDLEGVPHRLEKGTSASEDAEPRRGVDCDVLHWLGTRTKHHF